MDKQQERRRGDPVTSSEGQTDEELCRVGRLTDKLSLKQWMNLWDRIVLVTKELHMDKGEGITADRIL